MSQHKFMHPRNIYRKPPNFKEMAIQYPEFRKFAKPDISGKISLDFKNPEALRALTSTLLQKDFDLQVEIPLTRLIPTLPLRLNYILWIEDLLEVAGIHRSNYTSVKGIDIGTGASCIYPLLAAKKNGWVMIATDIDKESCDVAENNVKINNLQNLITVKCVTGDRLLTDVVQNNQNFTFSMCNPPFFSSEHELDFASKSRTPCRHPPNNGSTGDIKELVAPGGEIAFILEMMRESNELGRKIRIYTTMVGHKSSLTLLRLELKKLNVLSVAETRFCQGNTTRWGIAWTYFTNFSLQKAYQTPNQKKGRTPMAYVVPPTVVRDEALYTVDTITQKIKTLLLELQVQYNLKKINNYVAVIDIIANQNTWSHQRRKNRQTVTGDKPNDMERKFATKDSDLEKLENRMDNPKETIILKRKLSGVESNEVIHKKERIDEIRIQSLFKESSEEFNTGESQVGEGENENNSVITIPEKSYDNCEQEQCLDVNYVSESVAGRRVILDKVGKQNSEQTAVYFGSNVELGIISKMNELKSIESKLTTPNESRICEVNKESNNQLNHEQNKNTEHDVCKQKNISTASNSTISKSVSVPLLEAILFVRNLASEIQVELLWKGGSGGRESMHQVLQYIKNKLK